MPMSVQVPPRMVAKDSGISSLLGAMDRRVATASTTGRKMTATGVLFMKAEMAATVSMSSAMVRRGPPRPAPSMMRVIASSAPVRIRPADSTNMAATVTSAGLPKPRSASSGVTGSCTSRMTTISASAPTMSTICFTSAQVTAWTPPNMV